ncbi:NlpC/P60 family protein [Streptomyces sp. NPDC007205]|uniref:C40 family peptidase n=1 Tax=Streptomyces sp. NPDC007205 TaxID=3154316 RepID=UPI003406E6E7
MNDSKGCLFYALTAPVAFIFGLILLLTMVAGGDTSTASTGGLQLNTKLVPPDYVELVKRAGAMCKTVSPPLIAAQIEAESSWRKDAISHDPKTGDPIAFGISQFIPETWVLYGKDENGDGKADVMDPADAIPAQGRYDCAVAKDVASVPGNPVDNMLAAYNAGPAAVIAAGGVPNISETQGYVQKIKAAMAKYSVALREGGPGSAFGQSVIAAAQKQLDLPYIWGGGDVNGPTGGGFDCSGLVLYAVYQASGGKISLPHSSEVQVTMGTEVPRDQMQPGDIIGIQTTPGDYSHVAIYYGGGKILEAPRPGRNVRIAPLSEYDGMTQTVRRFG